MSDPIDDVQDGVGALTERPVADAMSSTSGGIPAQVGTGRSVNAPDIDALADKVQHTLALFRSGWTCGETLTDRAEESWLDAKDSLSSLVAIAKEAERDNDDLGAVVVQMEERAERAERQIAVIKTHLDARCEHLFERAERAERERDEERVRREVACIELRTRVERAERERDDVRAALETLDMPRCERCHALTESDLPEQLDAAEEALAHAEDEAGKAEARVSEVERALWDYYRGRPTRLTDKTETAHIKRALQKMAAEALSRVEAADPKEGTA